MHPRSARLTLLGAAVALFATPWLVPLPERASADAYFDGDRERILGLAHAVERDLARGASTRWFSTGSDRYDGEWVFGFAMTAAMGFGQAAKSARRCVASR